MKVKRFVGLVVVAMMASLVAVSSPSVANAGCDWSVGRYQDNGKIKSNPLPTGECTWFVDGKTDRNGWDIIFKVKSGRDAYKWYKDNLIENAKRGTIGYPGDIMVFNKGSFSSVGHVAYITSNGYWNGKRAWTVRHANWSGSLGQTSVESHCSKTIKQCTFVEDSSGRLKIVYYDSKKKREALSADWYPLLGFLYKK